MGDIIDHACAAADFRVEIARTRTTLEPEAVATGKCLYCEEPLPAGVRWCDNDCRAEWEHERDLKQRR